MISIKGFKNLYVIDLNKSTDGIYKIQIDSSSPCMLSYISDISVIGASIVGSNTLNVNVDMKMLKKTGFIVIHNLKREKIEIKILPNEEKIREHNYMFKLGKSFTSGNSITLNVISKENGINEPWSVAYSGEPISYIIDKKKTKLTLTLSMMLTTKVVSNIVLKQDNSGKEIKFQLRHMDNNSVELIKEAD